MKAVEVDERDSTTESHALTYRLYVFSGAANAVGTWDLSGAPVEVALETAATMADDNAKLWSLALVDRSGDGTALHWISGHDYNDDLSGGLHLRGGPAPYEWRLRAQMQDRYLAARVAAGGAPPLPDGKRVIRLFPEWGRRYPLWESFTDEYALDGGDLGLPAQLARDLEAWNAQWEILASDESATDESATEDPATDPQAAVEFGSGGPETHDTAAWNPWRAQGIELHARLQSHLADRAEVRPEFLW